MSFCHRMIQGWADFLHTSRVALHNFLASIYGFSSALQESGHLFPLSTFWIQTNASAISQPP